MFSSSANADLNVPSMIFLNGLIDTGESSFKNGITWVFELRSQSFFYRLIVQLSHYITCSFFLQASVDDASEDHHFRRPANDITSQLEINFGDQGRTGRGRGGPRGGRGGRGAAAAATAAAAITRPPRERRPDKVQLWRFSTAWYGSVQFTFEGFSTGLRYLVLFFCTTSAEVPS